MGNGSSGNPGTGPAAAPEFRFSTDVLPERERVGMFREVFARSILGVDIEPLGERPFGTSMHIKQLPGLNIVWAHTTAVRATRSRQLLADGKDGFAFEWSASPSFGERSGREMALQPNDGVLISCSDPGIIAHAQPGPLVSLTFPGEATALSRGWSDLVSRPIPASSPALELLSHYIEILRRDSVTATPELQRLAVAHVYDLLALALGATRETLNLARRRGLRAAHLAAIKDAISRNPSAASSIEAVAARRRLSPRQVQRLFEDEGTTFTAFVQDQRLLRAYRMLSSPRFGRMRIGDIALETGFSDLSWFNRLFRRRFGKSPSDVRSGL